VLCSKSHSQKKFNVFSVISWNCFKFTNPAYLGSAGPIPVRRPSKIQRFLHFPLNGNTVSIPRYYDMMSGDTGPHILNFCRRCLVRFNFRPLYPLLSIGQDARWALDPYGCCGEEINVCYYRESKPDSWAVQKLAWLLYWHSYHVTILS
jgi:hypothetical protein